MRPSTAITRFSNLRTKVDGNFDRTGLPDPVIINHHIAIEDDKIIRLTCRLAKKKSGT